MEINIKGKSIFVERSEEETNLLFYNRCWFIAKNKPKNEEEFKLLNSVSKLWCNKKFLKCNYNSETEKLIEKYNIV